MFAGLIPLDFHHLSDSIIQMAGILFCDSKDCETQASKQVATTIFCDSYNCKSQANGWNYVL
jgi:hypothetical protein